MRVSLQGSVRINHFGKADVQLFPLPGEQGGSWHNVESDDLRDLIVDHFDFLRSKEEERVIHGVPTRIEYTPKQHLRMVRFSAGYLGFLLIEDSKRVGVRARFFLEIPFLTGQQVASG